MAAARRLGGTTSMVGLTPMGRPPSAVWPIMAAMAALKLVASSVALLL